MAEVGETAATSSRACCAWRWIFNFLPRVCASVHLTRLPHWLSSRLRRSCSSAQGAWEMGSLVRMWTWRFMESKSQHLAKFSLKSSASWRTQTASRPTYLMCSMESTSHKPLIHHSPIQEASLKLECIQTN